jgi:WD40 repeat protein
MTLLTLLTLRHLTCTVDQPKLVAQQCGIFDGLCEWHQTDTCQVLVIAENRPVTQWHEDVTSIDGEIPLLHVWRSDSWQLTSTRAASRPISGMIYDKSRAQVIVAHIDRTLSIWQVSNELAVSHVRTSGTLPGSGRVLCPAVLSHSHVIVAPSEQGLYYSVPVDHVPADVKPSVTHVTPGLVYTLVQSIVDKCHLWICNDSGIHRAKFSITNSESVPQLKIEQLQSITCFDLACCGLDICRANGNHVAVGDLTGRVLVWDISQSTPKKAINTEAMIRSLTWWHEHELQYGTLSGEIYTWSVNSELAPQHVTNVTGGVTCLAWDPISQSVLAASTTEGQVYLLSRDQQGAWHQIGLIEARDQQPYVSSREIWSVAWSPCGNFLATGGEDRMTHIHRVQRVTGVKLAPKPEHVLHEKSAAVTCLDWQRDSKDRAVLAVSSGKLLNITIFSNDVTDAFRRLHGALLGTARLRARRARRVAHRSPSTDDHVLRTRTARHASVLRHYGGLGVALSRDAE